ncbi:MAG: ornithine carbamoyltransferase [Dehalococcoidia bacterium]|nr:MAG: ornithine carbamoyltransferase [Dehalococcoidia bacterium]
MQTKDFLSISDLSSTDLKLLLADAVELKSMGWTTALSNKTLALLFEKPSLRTRVSFEMAMRQLGGQVIYLSPAEVGLGKRESVPDVARVLATYVDVLAARVFSHETLEVLGRYADIPIINALSDREHPCQALADLLTIFENKGDLKGLTLTFIGDGNNVAASLALACALAGMNFNIATPEGYELNSNIMERAQISAENSGSEIETGHDPRLAVRGADVVYTDTWTSMGQEAENTARIKAFTGFQVDSALMSLADPEAIFMHCLPAHRGQEVSDEVIESRASVVFDQAVNRLHAQKAVLAQLLGGTGILQSCR